MSHFSWKQTLLHIELREDEDERREMKRNAIKQLENTPGNRRLYVCQSLTHTSYCTTYSLRYPTVSVGHPPYRDIYIYRYVLVIIFFRFLFLFVKKLHLHVHKTVQRTSCHSQCFLFKYSINITHWHLGYKRWTSGKDTRYLAAVSCCFLLRWISCLIWNISETLVGPILLCFFREGFEQF